MAINLTPSQLQRINELDRSASDLSTCEFDDVLDRERAFNDIVTDLSSKNREMIRECIELPARTDHARTVDKLCRFLVREGFAEVSTPTIISSSAIRRMGIDEGHPLDKQIFWLDEKRCLRPMLAPNLYRVMGDLARNVQGRFGIFEVGACYRKESRGSQHLEEFTMLNLVEIKPRSPPEIRLEEILRSILTPLGLEWEIDTVSSEVYGKTWDVMVDGVELASAAAGPHPLDAENRVDFPWFGIGMGVERLNMLRTGSRNIRKHSSSIVYLNGWRMDI